MRVLKPVLNFYIQSSLHVALAVYALIRITFLKLNISYDEAVAYFGFYGTIVGYNFIKYDELARVKKVKLTTNFKAIIVLSLLAAFASFYYFLALKTKTKTIGFLALLITVIYTLPFFPKKQNMRNWSGVKIYLVAIAWVAVTVFLPVINAEYALDVTVFLKATQRFLLVFVLMLLFEINDLKFDALHLGTIPQQIGIRKTKQLNYLLILLFLFLDVLKPNFYWNHFVITIFVAVILVLFTFFANENRSKYYTSFWVESVPLIWLIALLLFG